MRVIGASLTRGSMLEKVQEDLQQQHDSARKETKSMVTPLCSSLGLHGEGMVLLANDPT